MSREPVLGDFSSAGWLDRPGQRLADIVLPHRGTPSEALPRVSAIRRTREEREALYTATLCDGATRCLGAGERAEHEDPDPVRLPHERDLHRAIHSTAFRRLAGKTQVVTSPPDHVRTRLTHSLGVAQIATSICDALGLDERLAEAAALLHDCSHTPGGHAGEEAMQYFIPGFDHATYAADVMLVPLNLCMHTLDAVRNHSWSRPSPATPEGMVLAISDRLEYVPADFFDAVRMGLVTTAEMPDVVAKVLGATQREQIGTLVAGVVDATESTGLVSLPVDLADALNELRAFNYERIYSSPMSIRQRELVIPLLRALVTRYACEPALFSRMDLDAGSDASLEAAVTYVVGMTDRFAAKAAVELCGWDEAKLPHSV